MRQDNSLHCYSRKKQRLVSIKHLFRVLSIVVNARRGLWLPLIVIDDLVADALI